MGTHSEQSLEIALYSDDSSVRESVKKALGSRIAPDLPAHTISEFATGPALRARVDGGKNFDLYILDGESVPEGGLGIAKQLKDEVFNCPPVLLITARPSDNWLATWSKADATVLHPIDPFTIASKCASLLKVNSALAN